MTADIVVDAEIIDGAEHLTTGEIEWGRPIPDWPGYRMNSDLANLQVWSMPRVVPGKGGSLRRINAKQIRAAPDGRVCLSHEGIRKSFHPLRDLYPIVFPDLVEQRRRAGLVRQAVCRRGHPLIEPVDADAFRCLARRMFGCPAPKTKPKLTYWGTNNRICRWCCDDLPDFSTDNTYCPEYGVSRRPPSVRTSSVPVRPEPRVVVAQRLNGVAVDVVELNGQGLYTDNLIALEKSHLRWQINSSENLYT